MTGIFPARKYTERQRLAIKRAAEEGIKVPTIVKLAERGQLELDGERLDPFSLNPSSAYDITARHVKKEARRALELVAVTEPKDTVETLRRRLILITDKRIRTIERKQQKNGREDIDADEIRRLAGAIREIARIPGPSGEKPTEAPSTHTRAGLIGESRSELAQSILRTGTPIEPVENDLLPTTTPETQDISAELRINATERQDPSTREPSQDSDEPGSLRPPSSALVGTLAGVSK